MTIKPGQMRNKVTLQRVTRHPDAYGAEVETWSKLAELRAELMEERAADNQAAEPGSRGRVSMTFRIRFYDGLTVADQVLVKGKPFDLVAVREIEPRRGLLLEVEGAA